VRFPTQNAPTTFRCSAAVDASFGLKPISGESFQQAIADRLAPINSDAIFCGGPIPYRKQGDMNPETMDADFYRRRHELCLELAAMVPTAKPLFLRLSSLAETYAEKATAATDSAATHHLAPSYLNES
jgi:hypothetical protein